MIILYHYISIESGDNEYTIRIPSGYVKIAIEHGP